VSDEDPGTDDAPGTVDADRAYLARVRTEIDEEVKRRRASGDLPPQLESELEQLFLKHAPLGDTRQELHEVLRQVDAAAFIDPVVPVESSRPGGAVVKKGIRSMNFWYLRFITHQISQFTTAVSRALHILDHQVAELAQRVDGVSVPPSVVVDIPTPVATAELAGSRRRVLHAACADGWLVALLAKADIDAYGVDPRSGRLADQELGDLDLRAEPVLDHLDAVEPGALAGVVLSGLMEGSGHGERRRLLETAVTALSPGAVLVIHCLSPSSWEAAEAPPEADIVQARPYRPTTWPHLLGQLGVPATVTAGADGRDYLVVARLPEPTSEAR
jgi:hypothetical protein